MRVLLVGNSYVQALKKVLQDTCPKAQVEETRREDISPFPSTCKEAPDVIILGNKDLRFAESFKEIYPDTTLVLLLLEDLSEYRDAADKCGIDHLWVTPDLTVTTVRQTICPYA